MITQVSESGIECKKMVTQHILHIPSKSTDFVVKLEFCRFY